MIRILLLTIATALAIYAIWAIYCIAIQRTIIYPRHLLVAPRADEIDLPRDIERLWLNVGGKKVEAWLLPPFEFSPASGAPLFIYAHANAELIDDWPEHVDGLRELGMAVLLVEYPGYGRSEGEPTEQSLTETMLSAYDLVTARDDIDQTRVVVMGRSLGGGPACALAAKRDVKALMLISTFTSLNEMSSRYFIPKFLVLDSFNNVKVLKKFTGEVLVIHGTHDEIFPYTMAERLAAAAPHSELRILECSHIDCIPNWNLFWREESGFFERAGVLK